MQTIFILGVNGFIGHHLLEKIIKNYKVIGMDVELHRIKSFLTDENFVFINSDIHDLNLIEKKILQSDVVIPLVAIARPWMYINNPLRVFELDFEANLPIIKLCAKHSKRLIFPSSSEVYGMCTDDLFDPNNSNLVLGPIKNHRWIYSSSKQLLDRVIHAYGISRGLNYTIFRPFNWEGSNMDTIDDARDGSARVVSQFLGHILRGEDLKLVNGGLQRRCFTDIDDGISALLKILDYPEISSSKIYNIGNPGNDYSVKELAEMMIDLARDYGIYSGSHIVTVHQEEYYGEGYEDSLRRVPDISVTMRDLNWKPEVDMRSSLIKIFDFYVK